jgi:metallo-beta-lactamase class B
LVVRMKSFIKIKLLLGFLAVVNSGLFQQPIIAAPTDANEVARKNAEENAAIRKEWDSWNAPFKPFRIIGNIYYVGPSGISSFLITTPEGHILLDTGFESTGPRIEASVKELGFKLSDIKIILNSHAHSDHAGGHAAMQKLTGAKIMMSRADAALLESGGTNDFTPYSREMIGYPPAKTDRLLRDGDTVKLGGTTLTCHLTPGHTKGCMTWTMDATEDGKTYRVLFFGSTSTFSDVPLVGNANYPNRIADFTATYKKLKLLKCDVLLAPHAGFFGLKEKAARLEAGEKPNPFIDPKAYRELLKTAEEKFLKQLAEEQSKAAR